MAEHISAVHQTEEGVTSELLAWRNRMNALTPAMVVLALLALAGLVALIVLVVSGTDPRSKWGYEVAVCAFLLGAGQGGPIIVFISRLAKGFWAIPIRRAGELMGLTGIVSAPFYIVLLFQLPEWYSPQLNEWRSSIWFHWPGAPVLWDSIFILMLAFNGLAMLYFSAIPDWAAARDFPGHDGITSDLSRWFVGTQKQWFVLNMGFIILGAFYVMTYVYVHVFYPADMAMALVPGWASSIFPAYHAISGFASGLSVVLIMSGTLMAAGGLRAYITRESFWGASKILLATALLYFYMTWAEFLLPWYGRQPKEIQYLALVLFGSYKDLYILAFVLSFILPLLFLVWNPVRASVGGPVFVGCMMVTGIFLDRIRIYVSSWSIAGPIGPTVVQTIPPTQYPNLLDILIMIGAPAAVALLILLALRVISPVSIWEYKLRLLLRTERPFLATEVAVLAKPR